MPPADAPLSRERILVAAEDVVRRYGPAKATGTAKYSYDINRPGLLHAVMVRSRLAHGSLRAVETDAARAMPNVLGIYTAADLRAAGLGALKPGIVVPNRDGSPMHAPPRPALASGRVRFVGDGPSVTP